MFNLFKAFRSVKGSYQSDGFGLAVRFKQTHSPMRRTNRIFYALADKSRINQIKKPLPYSLNASQMPMHKGLRARE